MLKEHGHRKSRAGLERQITPMSDAAGTIIRTRIFRGRWTPSLDEALTRCRHQQRAMSRCVRGSRQWKNNLERLRTQRRAMHDRDRDHDAVRKAAREIARAYHVIALESLNIKGTGSSSSAWPMG